MNWKEFFKPSLIKIVLFIILFLIIPIPFKEERCLITSCLEASGDFAEGCPLKCEPDINIYYGYQFIIDDTPIYNDGILLLSNISLFILSYLISCTLISVINKFKNKNIKK